MFWERKRAGTEGDQQRGKKRPTMGKKGKGWPHFFLLVEGKAGSWLSKRKGGDRYFPFSKEKEKRVLIAHGEGKRKDIRRQLFPAG